jgi:SAM-dependent methyltransferase
MCQKRVLEVGLGYGTVSQKIAESGASYSGLDIADGPVEMVNSRLKMNGLKGVAQIGSILKCPFDAGTFDYVVAIGCYHHTGALARAINETWRVLKPGGGATVMVYNAYSYRRWLRWPISTFKYYLRDRSGAGETMRFSENERKAYDARLDGTAAPETDFVSSAHLSRLCCQFSVIEIFCENAGGEFFLRFIPRKVLLASLGKVAGLDLYVRLTK